MARPPGIGVAQQRRVGPAEAEDRGVGVAREHPVVGGGAERAGELDLLGVHVLDVVDDEVAHGGALGLEQVRVGDEGVEHRRDQLGGVERGRGRQRVGRACRRPQQRDLLVRAVEAPGRDPRGHAVTLAEIRELARPEAPLGGAQQEVAHLAGERGRLERGLHAQRPARRRADARDLAGEQLADHGVLLGAGQQARRRLAAPRGVAPEDGEGVGVHAAHERLGGRRRAAVRPVEHPAAGGDALAEGGRGPPVADEHQRAGVGTLVQQARDPLGQQRRLARAGPAQDAQEAGVVLDDPPRGVVEHQLARHPRRGAPQLGGTLLTHAVHFTTTPRQPRRGGGRVVQALRPR